MSEEQENRIMALFEKAIVEFPAEVQQLASSGLQSGRRLWRWSKRLRPSSQVSSNLSALRLPPAGSAGLLHRTRRTSLGLKFALSLRREKVLFRQMRQAAR